MQAPEWFSARAPVAEISTGQPDFIYVRWEQKSRTLRKAWRITTPDDVSISLQMDPCKYYAQGPSDEHTEPKPIHWWSSNHEPRPTTTKDAKPTTFVAVKSNRIGLLL